MAFRHIKSSVELENISVSYSSGLNCEEREKKKKKQRHDFEFYRTADTKWRNLKAFTGFSWTRVASALTNYDSEAKVIHTVMMVLPQMRHKRLSLVTWFSVMPDKKQNCCLAEDLLS